MLGTCGNRGFRRQCHVVSSSVFVPGSLLESAAIKSDARWWMVAAFSEKMNARFEDEELELTAVDVEPNKQIVYW